MTTIILLNYDLIIVIMCKDDMQNYCYLLYIYILGVKYCYILLDAMKMIYIDEPLMHCKRNKK